MFNVGDRVKLIESEMLWIPGGEAGAKGTVIAVEPMRVRVKFDDGEIEWWKPDLFKADTPDPDAIDLLVEAEEIEQCH